MARVQESEKYGVLCEEGVKYYNAGLGKVEQIKEFKDAKATQINDFKEAKSTQIKDFKEATTTQIKDFKEAKTTQIKDFKEAKATQLREFTEPKVEKIKGAAEPKVAQLREFTEPKVAQLREYAEPKVAQLREYAEPQVEKIKGVRAAIKEKLASTMTMIGEKVRQLLAQGCQKLTPSIQAFKQTSLFQKWLPSFLVAAFAASDTIVGKEKRMTMVSKVETWIPEQWKADPQPPSAKTEPSPVEELADGSVASADKSFEGETAVNPPSEGKMRNRQRKNKQ